MYKSCSWHRSVTVNQRNSKKEEMPNESWNYGDRKKMSKNKIRRLTVYARVCVCGNWYCTIIRIWSNCVGKLIWPTSLFFCNNCKCNCLQCAGIMEIVNCFWDCCSHAEILYYQNRGEQTVLCCISGIPLEVAHYNTLLAVYNQNKFKFSPSEFLTNMEANGVAPNRVCPSVCLSVSLSLCFLQSL